MYVPSLSDYVDGRSKPNVCTALDYYQRIRLINWIRKTVCRLHFALIASADNPEVQKPSVQEVNALTGKEELLLSDDWLVPALEDDPLLRMSFQILEELLDIFILSRTLEAGDDDWTDSDQDEAVISQTSTSDPDSAQRKINAL